MNEEKDQIKIIRKKVFYLKNTKVMSNVDLNIELLSNKCGYFILNLWEPFDIADLDIYPVAYIECNNEEEYYILSKENKIVGKVEDICFN